MVFPVRFMDGALIKVSIDLSRGYIRVTEKFLQNTQIGAVFHEMALQTSDEGCGE